MKLSPILACAALLSLAMTAPAFANRKTERYGSWGLTCVQSGAGRCGLVQRVALDEAGKKVVLSIHGDARGPTPHLLFRFSKHAIPRAGVAIKVGNHVPRRYRIFGCDSNICETRVPVTPVLLKEIAASPMLMFAFFGPDGKQASYPVPLNGFLEGWRALSARAGQAGPIKTL